MMNEPWLPVKNVIMYPERSPENLLWALSQFDVANNNRYRPWSGKTFCNIFMWDGSRALDCEIPHWVDTNGNGHQPFTFGCRELRANDVPWWMEKCGQLLGWKRCEVSEGEERAKKGLPVLLQWTNKGGPGHVAWRLPDGNLIQAGAKCGVMPVIAAFGSRLFTSYTHD